MGRYRQKAAAMIMSSVTSNTALDTGPYGAGTVTGGRRGTERATQTQMMLMAMRRPPFLPEPRRQRHRGIMPPDSRDRPCRARTEQHGPCCVRRRDRQRSGPATDPEGSRDERKDICAVPPPRQSHLSSSLHHLTLLFSFEYIFSPGPLSSPGPRLPTDLSVISNSFSLSLRTWFLLHLLSCPCPLHTHSVTMVRFRCPPS